MANKLPNLGGVSPNPQLDSHYSYPEPQRANSFVKGEADLPYGSASGFRFGIESTGFAHKKSSLGKKVRGG